MLTFVAFVLPALVAAAAGFAIGRTTTSSTPATSSRLTRDPDPELDGTVLVVRRDVLFDFEVDA